MIPITHEEFLKMADAMADTGSLRFANDGKQYLATINEVNFFDGGICVLVTGGVYVQGNDKKWVPALENCPTFHRFCWTDAHCHWVVAPDLEAGKICIDSDDGPIYILFEQDDNGGE